MIVSGPMKQRQPDRARDVEADDAPDRRVLLVGPSQVEVEQDLGGVRPEPSKYE